LKKVSKAKEQIEASKKTLSSRINSMKADHNLAIQQMKSDVKEAESQAKVN